MPTQAFFRVDASAGLGGGHLSRCLALAARFAERGAEVHFLCAPLASAYRQQIDDAGFRVTTIAAGDLDEDERATSAALAPLRSGPALLVVDHYSLDARWEGKLRALVDLIVAIDDLADRPHDCDLLVDQAFASDGSRYAGLVPDRCIGLFGTRYALLRPEFASWRDRIMQAGKRPSGVLHVFFGSEDSRGNTTRFARLALELEHVLEVRVAVSPRYTDTAGLEALRRAHAGRMSWEAVGPRMAEHMAGCDLAIGAPGQSTWERACLGLPALYIAIADNQVPILRRLADSGLCAYLGTDRNLTDAGFKAGCAAFLGDRAALEKMRETALGAVDGLGCARVVDRALEALA
jgi:UDP-2,4-diacetamido-2,4,6-trideoxy-beta-L-altropyranose hydrolase